jgi:hypothetical protein
MKSSQTQEFTEFSPGFLWKNGDFMRFNHEKYRKVVIYWNLMMISWDLTIKKGISQWFHEITVAICYFYSYQNC